MLPIQKLVAGALASAVVYVVHRFLGLDLGSAAVSSAVIPAVGFIVAYLKRDPRVQTLASDIEHNDLVQHVAADILAAIDARRPATITPSPVPTPAVSTGQANT